MITVVITANGNEPISNTASISASFPPDPQPANNSSTAVITPAPAAAAAIPTASEWALLMLALGLAWIAARKT